MPTEQQVIRHCSLGQVIVAVAIGNEEGGFMRGKIGISFILPAVLLLFSTLGARAEGALAVGTTGDIAKDGFAYGLALRQPTRESAIDRAVAECNRQGLRSGVRAAAAHCKL